MKRKQILSLLLCLFALGAMAKKQLVILHTNDTHSCIMPLSENLADTAIATGGNDKRGAAKTSRSAVFRQRRLLAGFALLHAL